MKNWIIVIPDLVLEEISNNIDIMELKSVLNCQSCIINPKNFENLKNRYPALANGELAVLFLSLNFQKFGINAKEAVAVLDDKAARSTASKLGIKYFGTLRLLKIMLDVGILTRSQFFIFIQKLKEYGFRFTDNIIYSLIAKENL